MGVLAGFASGCLVGDDARGGIEGTEIPAPFPMEFMIRGAEGVENDDESLGPAAWFVPN